MENVVQLSTFRGGDYGRSFAQLIGSAGTYKGPRASKRRVGDLRIALSIKGASEALDIHCISSSDGLAFEHLKQCDWGPQTEEFLTIKVQWVDLT